MDTWTAASDLAKKLWAEDLKIVWDVYSWGNDNSPWNSLLSKVRDSLAWQTSGQSQVFEIDSLIRRSFRSTL
jgi:hypothetical protein